MHRSGTSLATFAIQQLGFDPGDTKRLTPSNEFNLNGYWENAELTAVNDEILKRLGGSWHDPPSADIGWERSADLFDLRAQAEELFTRELGSRVHWIWKDPRTSLTLPFWLSLMPPETRFVICYRNPLEVCRSLQERDGIPPMRGSFLWQHYLASAVVATQERPRFFLCYESWFDPDDDELDRLGRFAAKGETDGKRRAEIQACVLDSLRHHQSSDGRALEETQIDFGAKWLHVLLRARNSSHGPITDKMLTDVCRSLLDANAERRVAQAELVSMRKQSHVLTHDLQSAQMRLEQSTERIRQVEIGIKQYEAEAVEFLRRLEESDKRRIEQVEATRSRLSAQLAAREGEMAQRILELEKQLAVRDEQLSERDSRIAEMQRLRLESLKNFETRRDVLAQELAKAQNRMLEGLQAFEKEKRALEQQLAEKNAVIEGLNVTLDGQRGQIEANQRNIKAKENIIEAKQRGIELRRKALEDKKKVILMQQDKIFELNKQLVARTTRWHQLTLILDRREFQLGHARAQLIALQQTKIFRYARWPRALWNRLCSSLFNQPKLTFPIYRENLPERGKEGPVAVALKTKGLPPTRLRVRQVYFSEKQIPHLMRGAVPYFNYPGDYFLESRVIVDCLRQEDHRNCDYYGVLSWRFLKKYDQRFTLQSIRDFIDGEPEKADVYSFFGDEPRVNVWKRAVDFWHPPLFLEIAQKIFDRLGHSEDLAKLDTVPIYSNHWVAKPEVFERFVREMLIPVMDVMEKDPEIRTLCFYDSGYSELFKDAGYRATMGHAGASPEECQRIFGVPYYPYHPFICERLISTWLAMNPDLRLVHVASDRT